MRKLLTKKKGFTLIELIIVIAILGILAAILIPRFGGFTDRARASAALVEAKQIATALDSLFAENDAWPAEAATDEDDIFTLAFDDATGASADGTWDTGAFGTSYNSTNGGFVWEVNGHVAGRANSTSPVEANPTFADNT